jgi:hypothetical protein
MSLVICDVCICSANIVENYYYSYWDLVASSVVSRCKMQEDLYYICTSCGNNHKTGS